MSEESKPSRSRRQLLLLFGIFAAPMVAAYVAYFFLVPEGRLNYGELLEPRPVPEAELRGFDGKPASLAALRGKWVLVQWDGGGCDTGCRDKLYSMRQIRLAQGKDMDRIERAWLVDDGVAPAAETVVEYLGTRVLNARSSGLERTFPAAQSVRDHVYLVDPLGNLMLRFPKNADPRRMVKDLTRLLKVSRIG